MSFRNSILAGLTLIREAIRSQNYEQGVEGWTINADGTAEFSDLTIRSSDGSGATVDIENGRAVFTAASGWQIIIDPTNVLPIVYFLDPEGDEMGSINASGFADQAGIVSASGPFADGGPFTDWRWAQSMGETATGDRAVILRLRDEDESYVQGGWLYLDPDVVQLAVIDSENSANNTLFQAGSHIFVMDKGRLVIGVPASASPGIWLQADAGHTGPLLELDEGGVTKARVTAAGDLEVAGTATANELAIADTTWQSYTPTITGGGAATFTVRDGYFYELGDLVFFQATWQVGTAGSGATAITVTAPVTIYRGGRRQSVPGSARDGSVAGAGPITGVCFVGGSGAVIDRVINSAGTDVTGALLTAGSIWTLEGWLRKA